MYRYKNTRVNNANGFKDCSIPLIEEDRFYYFLTCNTWTVNLTIEYGYDLYDEDPE